MLDLNMFRPRFCLTALILGLVLFSATKAEAACNPPTNLSLFHAGEDTNPIEYQYDPLGNIRQLKSITNGYRPFNRSPQDDPM